MPSNKKPRQNQKKEQGSKAIDLTNLTEEQAAQVRGGGGVIQEKQGSMVKFEVDNVISQKVRPK